MARKRSIGRNGERYRVEALEQRIFLSAPVDGNDSLSRLASPAHLRKARQATVLGKNLSASSAVPAPPAPVNPANDNFVNAAVLSGASATATGTNVNATKQAGEPVMIIRPSTGTTNPGGRSVWWKWTAPITGSATVSTVGSSFNTILGIFTGAFVASLSQVTGDDDNGGGGTSLATFTATAGTTYSICVDGLNSGVAAASGTISLSATVQNLPTSATITTPSGSQTRNVTINYTLIDIESEASNILPQYSTDGGTTWNTAAAAGTPTTGLTSSPGGSAHTFIWSSATNLPSINSTIVKFRITPSDVGGSGAAATTSAFTLINTLQPGSISGTVFNDANSNTVKDAGEAGLAGFTVFLDANQNSALDPGETATTSDSNGNYTFSSLPLGSYSIALVPRAGYPQTSPVALAGGVWHEDGPDSIGTLQPDAGRITSIAASATDPNTIYVAAAGGGVWKTTNGGTSWLPLTDSQQSLAMGAVAIAPSNASIIYAGTGEANNSADSQYGRGVLKSTDGGATWTLTGAANFLRLAISKIIIDPADPNIVYAAVCNGSLNGQFSGLGVWKTINGGTTWTNMTATPVGTTAVSVSDLVIDPTNHQILFAAFGSDSSPSQNGIWKTTNSGSTWTRLAGGLPTANLGRTSLGIGANGQTVYAAFMDTLTNYGSLLGFYQTLNGGTTWTHRTSTPDYMNGFGWYTNVLTVDPTNSQRVYAGSTGDYNLNRADQIIRSNDGGVTWTNVGNGANGITPHPDNHALAFDASGNLLDGNDGGIYKSTDQGANWTDLSSNLGITQFTGIAIDPNNQNLIFGGSQDNGTEKFTGSHVWSLVLDGDGGQTRYDPAAGTVYTTFYYQTNNSPTFFQRSDDGGNTWNTKTTGINNSDGGMFYIPYVMDPSNPSRLALGTDKVYITTNKGDSWTAISGVLGVGNVTALAISQSAPNTIYVSYTDHTVWVTTNGGTTWTKRSSGLPAVASGGNTAAGATDPGGTVSITSADKPEAGTGLNSVPGDIKIDPTNSLIVYVVYGEFASAKVLMTTNGGVSWTDISGNLPDLPVHAIVLDPRTSPATLYIGTDAGVYQTTNSGTTWTLFGTGLPNSLVSDLQISTTGNFLVAATHGRGAWTTSLVTGPREYSVTLTAGAPTATLKNFGNVMPPALVLTGSNVYLKEDADGVNLDIWINAATPGIGVPTQKSVFANDSTITFNGALGNDLLTLDYSAGNFSAAFNSAITCNGSTNGTNNTLAFVGTAGSDALTATATSASFASSLSGWVTDSVAMNRVATLQLPGGTAWNDSLTLNGGTFNLNADTPSGTPNVTVTIAAGATGVFNSAQNLAGIAVNGGTLNIITTLPKVIKATAFSITSNGMVDLGHNSLLTSAPVDNIQAYVNTAYNASSYGAQDGKWDGRGLTSSVARNAYSVDMGMSKYAVGYAYGSDQTTIDEQQGGYNHQLDGVGPGQTLIKPVLAGDGNMDGFVDFNDIQVVLGGPYNGRLPARYNQGDLTGDGVVDFNDIQVILAWNYNNLEKFI